MADLPPCPLGFIQSLYKDYKPFAGMYCKECGVGEPVDELFQECSRCGCFVYCSRECQKAHWKKEHKTQCTAINTGNETQRDIQKHSRRVLKFNTLYSPLIQNLMKARYILYNRERNEDTVKFPEGQTVAIYLAALPEGAKRPQLCIDRIIIRDMTDEERNEFDSSSLDCNGEYIVARYCLLFPSPSPRVIEKKVYYSPYSQATIRYKAKDMENFYRRFSSEQLSNLVLGHIQTINAIAKGERRDLHQAIKECMKQKKQQLENEASCIIL